MNEQKFLDKIGLSTFLEKLKTIFAPKIHSHTLSQVSGVTPSAIGAAPASHTQPEASLKWGGKNFAGSYGVIDASMIGDLGANRFAFGKPEGVNITYSRDNGSSWQDYGATNGQKTALFSDGSINFVIGKSDSEHKADSNCLLRIEIDTSKFRCYSQLHKFAIYVSTNGSSGNYCTIDIALQSSPSAFKIIADKVEISGWSGWNIINVSDFVTYGNNENAQYGRIRFTFGCESHTSSEYSGLSVNKIMAFGGVGWGVPSTMAQDGHLYSYDYNQNAIFPANVSAKSFTGVFNGTATYSEKIKDAGDGRDITINYSKPDSKDFNYMAVWENGQLCSTNFTQVKTKLGLNNVNNTADSEKSVKYATSAGTATSATKLGSENKGSATQPIYLNAGTPTACTYTLGKSVPTNAVFTDTWRGIQDNLTSDSVTDSLSAHQGKLLKGMADSNANQSKTNKDNIVALRLDVDNLKSVTYTTITESQIDAMFAK